MRWSLRKFPVSEGLQGGVLLGPRRVVPVSLVAREAPRAVHDALDEQLRASLAKGSVADALEVDEGAHVLEVNRVAYDALDRPVELRKSFIIATTHSYDVTLKSSDPA